MSYLPERCGQVAADLSAEPRRETVPDLAKLDEHGATASPATVSRSRSASTLSLGWCTSREAEAPGPWPPPGPSGTAQRRRPPVATPRYEGSQGVRRDGSAARTAGALDRRVPPQTRAPRLHRNEGYHHATSLDGIDWRNPQRTWGPAHPQLLGWASKGRV